jgi:hypothetical protein
MPLSINVGLSRKASKDYQSTGVSINVTAELDQSLLARPDDLQKQIGDLYAHARHALETQAGAGQQTEPGLIRNAQPTDNHRPRIAGSDGNGRHASPMTASQRRAIEAIARRLNIDPAAEARDVIGAQLEDLSLRQASELIDHLKGIQPAKGRGGR